MINSTTVQNAEFIKSHIRQVLQQDDGQIEAIIRQMQAIVHKLQAQTIQVKKNRWWDIAFSGQLGTTRLNFKNLQVSQEVLKTSLNALQGLIDLIAAILTGRPQTSLVAYYRTSNNKGYRVQASPSQFFTIQQASIEPLQISLTNIKQLANESIIDIEEDTRLLRTIERVQNEEAKANKGHGAEAYEALRENRRIGKKLISGITTSILNRTSWNKKGDIQDRQVKYLGQEGNYFGNTRTTASLVSIEEITSYFIYQLYPLLKNSRQINLDAQVEAIYQAFVDTENLQFYGQGFSQESAKDYIQTVQTELNKVGIRRITINF